MKNYFSTAYFLFCFFLFSACVFAQNPQATPPNEQANEAGEIIRISSELVLVDALVLDKDGKQVTDLSAEDVEIWQDGKPQKIVNFAYINSDKSPEETNETNKVPKKGGEKFIPAPPISARSNQGRIITFVIDDGNCLATIEGTSNIKDGVKKFINEQMLADDRVAIYQTRGGSSLVQMYTSNKEILKRLVDKVNWFPSACGSTFEPFRDKSTLKAKGGGADSFESEADKQFRKDSENRERENQVIGTVGVMGFVVDRLKNLPQRKTVFLLSEGIIANFNTRAHDALREIADKALRSSVVVNTLSAKGVTVPGMLSAQDEVLPGIISGADQTGPASLSRIEEERALNEGLSYLAYTTGGKFIRNKNFLETGIKEVLDAEKGYYLIGYQPEEETFKGKDFHKIEVKLKRPELRVSSRKGFYGRADTATKIKNRTTETPLYQAIASPLQENGMDIRLTTLVGNDPGNGNFIRAILHIKGQNLIFIDEKDGTKKVVLDVVAITLDEKGKVIDEFNRTYPIRIPQQGVQTVRQNGLDYSTDMPIKKPGFYSFRLAVRDNQSKRLGSAGDFIEVPDLKKGELFMSGLVTTSMSNEGRPILPKNRPANVAFEPVFINSIPSIRQYSGNSVLAYTYSIYNAKLDSTTNQPKLAKQIRLYKNGKLIVEGKETPIANETQSATPRIQDNGSLRINPNTEVGEYFLQIIVRDTIANKTVSQWIDFEIVQ